MRYELYQVTNKINGKMYIGQTCQGHKRRWYIHCWKSARGGEQRFHKAIRDYGKENFEVKCLVIGPSLEWINEMEIRAIKLYDTFNNGYNDTKGGDGTVGIKSRLGKKHTAETRAKLSASCMGRPSPRKGMKLSEETKQKLRAANLGKKIPREVIEKIVSKTKGRPAWNKGLKHSEETKAKMSLAHKGKKRPASVGEKTRARLLGTRLSEETKRKISESHKLMWKMRGASNK
jgi:group I intron endonuclease